MAIAELTAPYARNVAAVLCFTGQDEVDGWCRDVMICSTSNLAHMLLTRPVVLGPDQVTDAWFRLDGQLRSAMDEEQSSVANPRRVPSRTSSRGAAQTVRKPRRRGRNGPSVSKLLVSLAVLAAFPVMGPAVATAVGGVIAGMATSHLVPPAPCVTESAAPTSSVDAAQDRTTPKGTEEAPRAQTDASSGEGEGIGSGNRGAWNLNVSRFRRTGLLTTGTPGLSAVKRLVDRLK